MKKKKVLFVIHQLNIGGAQKSLISALNAVDYSRYEVTLYIRKDRLDLLDYVNKNVHAIIINDDKTNYYRKPRIALMELMLWAGQLCKRDTNKLFSKQSQLIAECRQEYEYKKYFKDAERFDIAVSYIQGYTAEFVEKYVKADRKILFFHTSTDDHHELHEKVMAQYDKIVAVSSGALECLKRFYPQYQNKMIFLDNYVDTEEIRKLSDAYSPQLPPDKLALCTCGRLSPVKGFDLAVKAAALLKRAGLDFCWFFVGDGPERRRIEKMIEKSGLEDEIRITGLLTNPYPYLKACDIYIQPSYEESFSLTLYEAQILKKTVVSTDTVGGKSLIKNGVNGCLTDISADALAKGILSLASDENLRKRISESLLEDDALKRQSYQRAWESLLD